MSDIEMYPWQSSLWQQLTIARGRLPHALLLRGSHGIGKFDFARALARSLLCQTPLANGHACSVCAACNWFSQGNHPDYRLLTPAQEGVASEEEPAAPVKSAKKSQISVSQIRELSSFLELSSHRGDGRRIVLIHPAEALNAASANALLKMLEEPPPDVIFILVSSQPQKLLPTILSRCQKVDMPSPEKTLALRWLEQKGVQNAGYFLGYASGAPLSALSDAEEGGIKRADAEKMLARGAQLDPFAAATLMVTHGMEAAIGILQKWIYDLTACHLADEIRYHERYAGALQALSKSVDLGLLLDFQRKLDEARKSATHPLNHELQLESLLLQYTQVFSR